MCFVKCLDVINFFFTHSTYSQQTSLSIFFYIIYFYPTVYLGKANFENLNHSSFNFTDKLLIIIRSFTISTFEFISQVSRDVGRVFCYKINIYSSLVQITLDKTEMELFSNKLIRALAN